jgi:hypothetical protein
MRLACKLFSGYMKGRYELARLHTERKYEEAIEQF